jgi:predicted transcriptional regulator
LCYFHSTFFRVKPSNDLETRGPWTERFEKMTKRPHNDLSRRERQIIDIMYANGRATAAEVQAALPEPPSYSAVRAMLRILEEKGHVRHEQDGPRYVYLPTLGRDNAQRSALHHMLKTFFDGSAEQAISALLDESSQKLSDAELDRLARLIDQARNAGA